MKVFWIIFVCSTITGGLYGKDAVDDRSLDELLLIHNPSGEVLAYIGNAYAEKSEYGLALAHYTRALQKTPRDNKVMHNKSVVWKQADCPPKIYHWSWCIGYLSSFERHITAIGLIWLTLVLFSLYVWFGWFCVLWRIMFVLTLFVVVICGWYSYGRAPCGIMLCTTVPQGGVPLRIGEEVDVLASYPDRHEVRIETASGSQFIIGDTNIMICE